ncbi:nuclear GTPase SLIP-GC isoform X2 [Oncorhynchus kisutch]|uniref:nuclear GTPase SLIP-GC isoform X2 n=1 Tax=Oncorhynchus kisutch TaxID=8019 RepID=UPI0012DC036E|nr:nuclear GTPase SLIP-GC-like isoform X2 [Oncorhynchus kisutch]
MDNFVRDKLTEWNFSEYIDRFKDEEIDKESFLLLDEKAFANLIPKLGPRYKFQEKHKAIQKELENDGTATDSQVQTSSTMAWASLDQAAAPSISPQGKRKNPPTFPSTSTPPKQPCFSKPTQPTSKFERQAMKAAETCVTQVLEKLKTLPKKEFIDYLKGKMTKLRTGVKNKVLVGVFGKTGAGKSSLINAILGEPNCLPNGANISACTSVMIQVEANMTNYSYEAEIEFISKKEWEDDIKSHQDVMSDENDNKNEELVRVATAKIQAFYGKDGVGKSLKDLMKGEHFREIPEFLSPTNTVKMISCGTHLSQCSSVWIVNDIQRAASEREPWMILESSFSYLIQGGECENITFICTKTDDINPKNYLGSPVLKNTELHLDLEKKGAAERKRGCIQHRNEQAKIMLGERFNDEVVKKKPFIQMEKIFQVFTVSAEEFQNDENPILEQEQTEIPQLKQVLEDMNERHSKTAVKDYISGVYGILSLIKAANSNDSTMVEMKSNMYQLLKDSLEEQLSTITSLMTKHYNDLKKLLSEGVANSKKSCLQIAKEKVITPEARKDGRGYHRTLSSLCRNKGFCRSTNGDITDLNKTLAESMYAAINEKFAVIFPNAGTTGESIYKKICNFSIISDNMAKEWENTPMSLYLMFLTTEEHFLKDKLKRDVLLRKKVIYESLTDEVQIIMCPCYEEASKISGKGTLKKTQELLVKHIDSSKNPMFDNAQKKMLEGFENLREYIEQTLRTELLESLKRSLKTPNSLSLPDVSEQLENMETYKMLALRERTSQI